VRDGTDGKSAYTVVLSNENDTFIQEGGRQEKTTTIALYKGTALQTLSTNNITIGDNSTNNLFTITPSVTNGIITLTIVNSVNDTTTNVIANGSIPITITYDNLTFTKQFSYTSIIHGTNGITYTI